MGFVPGDAGALTRAAAGGAGRRALLRAGVTVFLLGGACLVLLAGPAVANRGTGEAGVPGAGGLAVLRWVVFCGLCVLTGEACAGLLLRGVPEGPVPVRRGGLAALLGVPAAVGLAVVAAGGNQVPHSLAEVDFGGLYHSRDGVLALIEINAFLVAGVRPPGRAGALRAAAPPAAIVVAEAFRAHPTVETSPLAGAALTLVHLASAALWVGCLWQVLRTLRLWRGRPPLAGALLLGRYARVAGLLLAVVAVTGTVSTLRRMPPGLVAGQLLTTAYGRTLLVKLLLVAATAGLALAARLRLRRAAREAAPGAEPVPGAEPQPGAGPSGAWVPARAELVVLGAVVAVSALLTVAPIPPRW